jgi:single-strand selective monofunctional uracil DNA glycosylase
MSPSEKLLAAGRRLSRELAALRFAAPVTHVYDPTVYARRPHARFLRRYATGPKRVVFLGMNPGPFGMAQTGVPFGDVGFVRDWLGIEAPVGRPTREHPRRPVQGFACPRGEVSGQRLWGAIAERYGKPDRFFRHAFVANYCPLVFLEASGRNRTPDHLRPAERRPLFTACDRHLRHVAALLEPEWVVGIGRFAEERAREALAGSGIQVGGILHPSPASPAANRGWARTVVRQLAELGVCRAGSGGG